jgi:alanine racemase
MSLKAHVILVKEITAGTPVSYGRKWVAERTSRIATIPIGYADGYSRLFTNRARVLVNGQHAPIVGAVCMDQCMVDVTDVNGEVKSGDEVVLFGAQGGKRIEVEELATLAGTIPYEIVCLIGKRIPRVYRRNGEIVQIRNYLI